MGVTQISKYTDYQNETAQYLKVLAHPARIAILQFILKTNACICGDIVEEIGLAQATVSQHLKELKSIGIIKGNVEGTSVCYCINEEVWEQIKDHISDFFGLLEEKNNCC